ncbi:MAG: amidohydrolase [Fibrobacterota bacterium]
MKIYHNGRIATLDSLNSTATAFVVDKGVFSAVGNSSELLAQFPAAEKIDLQGRCVIPGIIEGHCHPMLASTSELMDEIPNLRELPQLFDWLRRETKRLPAGSWIYHPMCFPTRFREMRQPTLAELDALSPDHPVLLNGSFAVMVNSAALKCGLLEDFKDSPVLVRDPATGRPTGLIRIFGAALMRRLSRPQYAREQRLEALCAMHRRYHAQGITSANESLYRLEEFEIYRELHDAGRLTLRTYLNIMAGEHKGRETVQSLLASLPWKTRQGTEFLRMGPFKIYLDGGILTGTAFLDEPWGPRALEVLGGGSPEFRGTLNYTPDELFEVLEAAIDSGFTLTAHVTGGGGVTRLLDAFERLDHTHPVRDLRLTVLHGNFFTRANLERCLRMNVSLDLQPGWLYLDTEAMLDILGPARMESFHPWRRMQDMGLRLCAGSDHMVKFDANDSMNPYNPFLGLATLVTRRTQRGLVFRPQEGLTRLEALRAYTVNNAYKSGEEKEKGSIEPGKYADFAVLDRDYFSCPENDIASIRVLKTVVGGRTVYSHKEP